MSVKQSAIGGQYLHGFERDNHATGIIASEPFLIRTLRLGLICPSEDYKNVPRFT